MSNTTRFPIWIQFRKVNSINIYAPFIPITTIKFRFIQGHVPTDYKQMSDSMLTKFTNLEKIVSL